MGTSSDAKEAKNYLPIEDYGFLADCHSSALVSRVGSVDWFCMPRLDSRSIFARLLDFEKGGFCSIAPSGAFKASRRYLDKTLVLETTFETDTGRARLLDCMTMREGGRLSPRNQLLRVVEGIEGRVEFSVRLSPRFDYGAIRPWITRHSGRNCPCYSVMGGADGLIVSGLPELEPRGRHDLEADFAVEAGERARLSLIYREPAAIEDGGKVPDTAQLDVFLDETIAWWRRWAAQGHSQGPSPELALRSALVLKGLTNAPTGAIAAAPTTSLPESMAGGRNWDYRYSWVRDSVFSVRALHEMGFEKEADGFRRFIERSAAGSARDIQIMYGLGGERRLEELSLPGLEGWRGVGPVRVGNAAHGQVQHDLYGQLLDLAQRWSVRGHEPDDDYWDFLCETVNAAARAWKEPDRGIWEVRGEPRHFVHSKAGCWAALDKGVCLAVDLGREAPVAKWSKARDELRAEIMAHGYDKERRIFVRSYGEKKLDAALLLLPVSGFVEYDDPDMVRTVDAITDELMEGGLLRRYDNESGPGSDGLTGREGVFLACTFWLAECLACQDRESQARELFDRAAALGNDLGLFAEEYAPGENHMLGNYPQGLTHLSLITANLALAGCRGEWSCPIEREEQGAGG